MLYSIAQLNNVTRLVTCMLIHYFLVSNRSYGLDILISYCKLYIMLLLKRIEKLSQQWVNCAPPLRGFVGVDMIIGSEESEDVILAVNPRMTSSYLTLRNELKEFNIARHWLQMHDSCFHAKAN